MTLNHTPFRVEIHPSLTRTHKYTHTYANNVATTRLRAWALERDIFTLNYSASFFFRYVLSNNGGMISKP